MVTYSQLSTSAAASSDIIFLECAIEAAQEELEQAKIAGQQKLMDAVRKRLDRLEAKLAELEE